MSRLATLLLCAFFAVGVGAFAGQQQEGVEERLGKLPNGRSRTLAVLKADHEKTLEKASEMVELARELEQELEANTEHVLSLAAIEKAEP